MTIFEHLEELRRRVMYALVYWILCTCVVGFYSDGIMGILLRPFMEGLRETGQATVMIYTEPTASFSVVFKIVMILGGFLASPFIAWEIWGFVASGLFGKERRMALVAAPVSFLLFCAGVVFFYLWVLPPAVHFLYGYGRGFFPDHPEWKIVQMPNIPEQVSFFLWMSFSMGLVFQLPLVMYFLNLLGLVEARSFTKYQRHFILGATLAAAIITPTGDAVTLTLFMIPILGLFYAGLGAVYLREKAAGK